MIISKLFRGRILEMPFLRKKSLVENGEPKKNYLKIFYVRPFEG